MTTSLARLVFPALRWRRGSFAHERPKIDQALAAGVGGFIVFGGTRAAVATLTSELRQQAGRPLLLGADLERGAGQQVKGLTELPPAAALGSLDDLDATHAAALITANEALSVGLNWAFAPVCDLDVEPENPIIQTRSFGADPQRVGEQAAVWVHGCQDHGVLACAKHYPGHGRTTQDSHATVPQVATPFAQLAEQDLAPFEFAIRAGVGSMMAAYVAYPGWDASGRAAAFSAPILGYVRDPLNFSGFLVTDALIMGGATATQAEAPATVTALAAGCDGLLYPEDFAGVIAALDAAVGRGIPMARADEALARYERALGEWGRGKGDGAVELAPNAEFGDQLALRTLRWVRGEKPKVRTTVKVSVVDDDAGGPYVVGSRAVFSAELRAHGKRIADNGQPVVAVFANPLSWKGHADLSARSRAALRRLVPGAAAVVLFGHPRLAAQIPGQAPVLCAWGGDAVMQRAAARAISGD
ncbi:MAG TPA: glycoside hydrolase family 3 N-terminal domain-containing protein [Gemmatimonadales bacterium]